MIIDIHTHLFGKGWIPKQFFYGIARFITHEFAKQGVQESDEEVGEGIMEASHDPEAASLLAEMEEAGVDKSILLPLDYGIAMGDPEVPIEEVNRKHAELAKKHPERLISFAGVDPLRRGALDIFKQCVEEWGMRGLKLHPTTGFYPDDPVCYPLYEKALELDVPVLFHTGTQPAPMKAKYSRPICVDGAAADFPDLKIIMAHVGHCWWEEAVALAGSKWNLYIDISGWQREFLYHPNMFYEMLRRALDEIGPWRVMYGTDNPYLQLVMTSKDWVQGVQNAVNCEVFPFSKEEIDIVMGPAAERLYNIKS